ncbi:MAG: endonuclease/exonuclease/phosphatase family metal-dependent hydrolase [Marivirga sp.]|jgi:endonuclease/exonuclease/phosphatase family metal-dependent hydrolase
MMLNKKFLKLLTLIVLALVLIFITFYYWAGSGNLAEADYLKIKQYGIKFTTPSDTIKVMTYNIGYLSGMTNNLAVERTYELIHNNLHRSSKVLEEIDPDIVGFQEIDFNADRSYNFNQLDSLAVLGNYSFGAAAVNWDKSYVPFPYWPIKFHFGMIVSGQAVLSKMSFISHAAKVLIKPKSAPFYYNKFYLERLVQLAFLKVGNHDTLVVMNTHLEAFDEETREVQVAMVAKMYKEFSPYYAVILMGDFNSKPPFANDKKDMDSTLGKIYEIEGIKEAISKQEYLANEDRFFTFDTDRPYERLDYIFYSGNRIRKIDAGVVYQAGTVSDHLPVWLSFTLKK